MIPLGDGIMKDLHNIGFRGHRSDFIQLFCQIDL